MKKVIAILACLSFILLSACSSNDDPTVSETTTETITSTATTTPTTELTTEQETTVAIPLELNDTFYGDYFSIDVSNEWDIMYHSGYTHNYDVVYKAPDIGWITITLHTAEFSSFDDFYNSFFEKSKDTIFENEKNVKLLHRKKTTDSNRVVDRFFIYNNSYVSSIEFSYGFPKDKMELIINTLEYTDSLSDLTLEAEDNSTEPTTTKATESTTTKATKPATTKPSITTGQENALKKAKRYIEYTPMSFDGLIEQLEYEGFSNDEARYGAENCGANWNEQALKKAMKYIDYSGFSYTKLIEQLEYEKFSHEQAVYGADNCGADWNAEAAESAQKYMDFSSMSREQLLDQLLYEGYTQEQAEYGLSSVGY